MNGSLPRAEVRLHAAEAHHRDLQAGGPDRIACWSDSPRRQQWGAQRGAQGRAQASAQPAQGRHLGERGEFTLGPRSLLILLDGWKLLHDPSIALIVSLRSEREGRTKQMIHLEQTETLLYERLFGFLRSLLFPQIKVL